MATAPSSSADPAAHVAPDSRGTPSRRSFGYEKETAGHVSEHGPLLRAIVDSDGPKAAHLAGEHVLGFECEVEQSCDRSMSVRGSA
jgi:DNA-binding GntR family transcriptional regulator